jgi:hypothetical protein
VAWLAAEGQIFAARRQGPGFGGALWRLVDGLYSQRGPDARLLLRQRIFTEAALDPFDWGVLKVAARRHGLLTRPVLDTIVFMPPLCATLEQVESGIAAIRSACREVLVAAET